MMDLFDFRNDPIMSSLILLVFLTVIGGCVLFGIENIATTKMKGEGEIVEMHFVHGNQTTTVGMAFTHKGAAPVIATSGHPDEWSIIVKMNGHHYKVDCDPDAYYSHEIGDKVDIDYNLGGITHRPIHLRIINKQWQ